jgi:hypothetical protein
LASQQALSNSEQKGDKSIRDLALCFCELKAEPARKAAAPRAGIMHDWTPDFCQMHSTVGAGRTAAVGLRNRCRQRSSCPLKILCSHLAMYCNVILIEMCVRGWSCSQRPGHYHTCHSQNTGMKRIGSLVQALFRELRRRSAAITVSLKNLGKSE